VNLPACQKFQQKQRNDATMSSSPFLSAATLSCEGVRVDSFKPLHMDTNDHVVSPHYQPLKKLFTAASFARFKNKGQ
jgi:hypothetical protein